MIKKINLSDNRYLYLLIITIAIFAAVVPINWPVNEAYVNDYTRAFYSSILEILAKPGGATIYIPSRVHSGTAGDMSEACLDALKLCVQYHARIISFAGASNPDSGPVMEIIFRKVYGEPIYASPLYGKEFIWLGVVPGGDVAVLQAHAQDIVKYSPRDNWGNLLSEMPMIKNGLYPKGVKDIDLVLSWNAVNLDTTIVLPYKRKFLMIGSTESVGDFARLLTAGWLQGFLIGQAGAVEFETLLGIKGTALRYTTSCNFVAVLAIGGIILNNIYYIKQRGKKIFEDKKETV